MFERHEADGGLLGSLDATAMSAGDVFTPGLAIGPRGQAGRGFAFSTAPLEQPSVFDRIDLRGELPAGADVELYVNDVLRGAQRTPVNGRYEFLGVPLVRGTNEVRLVTYGARGERTEQTRLVNVGGGQLKPGQTTFDFGLAQEGRPVLGFGDVETVEQPGSGSTRAVASAAYGLNTQLTLVGGAGLYAVDDGDQRQLLTLGARTSLLGLAVQADAASDQTGGKGYALGLAGQRFGVSAVLRHSAYQDGLIDQTYSADRARPLVRHTELTADTSVPLLGDYILPLSLRMQRQAFADRTTTSLAAARVSTTLAGTLLSTGVDLVDQSGPDATMRRANGVVAASRATFGGWQVRGSLDYDLGLVPGVTSGSVTADREFSDTLALRFGVGESFGSDETSLQTGAIFRTSLADIMVSGDYAPDKEDLRLGLRLAFGLAPT